MQRKIVTAGNCPRCNHYFRTVYDVPPIDRSPETNAKGKTASSIIKHLQRKHGYKFSDREAWIQKWIHIRGGTKVIESKDT